MFYIWGLLIILIIVYFLFKNSKPIVKPPLIILDMNKLLVFRAFSKTMQTEYLEYIPYLPDAVLLGEHYTWKRPHLDEFIKYLLDNYQVAVWSSAWAKNVNLLCDFVFGNRRRELLFEWNQTECVRVDLDLEKKPLFKKPLTSVWKAFPDLHTIIIIDDSELKMQDNPPENVIITKEWTPKEDSEDLFNLIEKIENKII